MWRKYKYSTKIKETSSYLEQKSNTGLLRYTLFQKFDVHGTRLAPELIDQFVEVITPLPITPTAGS